MFMRKKNIIFLTVAWHGTWHAIYLWLWIQIRDSSRFDNSTFLEKSILFLTLYFSLLMVACTRIKEKFFSPLGSGLTASAKLLLSGLNMTGFPLPYTRVTYHITRPRSKRFQNGRRLSVKKNFYKIWFCTTYRLFNCSFRIFNLRGMYKDKKKEGGGNSPSVTH